MRNTRLFWIKRFYQIDKPMQAALLHEQFILLTSTISGGLANEAVFLDWYLALKIRFKPEVGIDFMFSNDGSKYQKSLASHRRERG
jgi:hypothetical protein